MKGDVRSEVRKLIEGIKEIVQGYTDDDIYAMLQECNMDPNETAQKLLAQDPFHEVKRKRDKKKENMSIQNSVDSRSRPENQSRGGRGSAFMSRGSGRGSYRPYYMSPDVGGGRGFTARENGSLKITNKGANSSVPPCTTPQTKACTLGTSSLPAFASGTSTGPDGSSIYIQPSCTSKGDQSAVPGHTTMADVVKASNVSQLLAQQEITVLASTSVTVQGQITPQFQQTIALTPISGSGVCSSMPDPVYVPSLDLRASGVVGAIKRGVGTVGVQWPMSDQSTISLSVGSNQVPSNLSEPLQLTQSGPHNVADLEVKGCENNDFPAQIVNTLSHDHPVSRSSTSDGDHMSEMKSQECISCSPGASADRTSVKGMHCSSRPQQQPVGPQKAIGPNTEWKRKPPNQSAAPSPGGIATSTVNANASEFSRLSSPASDFVTSEDTATKLQEKLEQLNVRGDQQLIMPNNFQVRLSSPASDFVNLENSATKLQEKMEHLNVRGDPHLIMPNHLQVPEAACIGLSFGSFGTFFGTALSTGFGNSDTDKNCTPLSEAFQKTESSVEEPISRTPNPGTESSSEDYSFHQQTAASSVENISRTVDVTDAITTTVISQSDLSKQDPVVQPELQYSLVQTAPSYSNVGVMPQIMGQYPSYEPPLSNIPDASRPTSFVMQQPYEPSTSCYAPFLRPGGDGDTRFSPFAGPSAAGKDNGNVTLLSGSSQETVSSVVLSSSGPTAPGTQTAGIAQQMHMFPQAAGVHISHFPPTYFSYPHQYFSPLYFSPPAINNFAGNMGYPQPSTGTNYPVPAGTSYPSAAAALKYSLSQYKPLTAAGNSSQAGFPVGYASYTAAPSGFSPSPAVTGGSRSGFEEDKESNLYIPSQQVEGSAFWFRTPPQNPSGMQSGSYYNLSAQGQNAAFAPTQSGHAAYAGLYHPAQSGLVPNSHQLLQQSETLGVAAAVTSAQVGSYQQSQGQLNWANNY
eukprot:Gb_00263 [translate_table: standard]